MTTAICTLFERDYHHGLAALVNSLVRSGFTGPLYAGYRGELPAWTKASQPAVKGRWADARVLAVGAGEVVFLPLATADHFTNHKPQFMLDLLEQDSLGIEQLFYLDPDICVAREWQFFEDWITCGVALCEDVDSPLDFHHPRRVGWRRHFAQHGIALSFHTAAYVNGGCVGVARRHQRFLDNWRRLIGLMADVTGGPGAVKIEGGEPLRRTGFASCFDCSDQDALNAAMEMTEGTDYSILPQAAMAFAPGAAVLPHALGRGKPWRRRYLRDSLRGVAPTTADKAFWNNVDAPLSSMSAARVRSSRLGLRLASAIGRFYQRS
jgi:hypothetical protein